MGTTGIFLGKTEQTQRLHWSNRRRGFRRSHEINHLMGTLNPHSNGSSYSNTVIGTLAVHGWAVTFGTARIGLGGLRPRPVLSLLYQM